MRTLRIADNYFEDPRENRSIKNELKKYTGNAPATQVPSQGQKAFLKRSAASQSLEKPTIVLFKTTNPNTAKTKNINRRIHLRDIVSRIAKTFGIPKNRTTKIQMTTKSADKFALPIKYNKALEKRPNPIVEIATRINGFTAISLRSLNHKVISGRRILSPRITQTAKTSFGNKDIPFLIEIVANSINARNEPCKNPRRINDKRNEKFSRSRCLGVASKKNECSEFWLGTPKFSQILRLCPSKELFALANSENIQKELIHAS